MTTTQSPPARRRACAAMAGGVAIALVFATGTVGGASAAPAAGAGETPRRITSHDAHVTGYPNRPVRVGDAIYYEAYTQGSGHREVWRSTDDGVTEQVTDIKPHGNALPGFLTAAGDLLLYVADDGTTGFELWQTDTTTDQTTRLTDLDDIPPTHGGGHGPPDEVDGSTSPSQLTVMGDTLYFQGDDGRTGRELWQTNTRTGVTRQRADIRSGGGGSFPQELTAVGSNLFFSARAQGSDQELWRTVRGERGAKQVADIRKGPRGSWPVYLLAVGDHVYFRPNRRSGPQLWRAGRGGAHLVADLYEKKGQGSDIEPLLDDDGRLIFRAKHGFWTLD